MAKRVGQMNEDTGRVEVRRVRRHKVQDFPWTRGPQTTGQKIARALWG